MPGLTAPLATGFHLTPAQKAQFEDDGYLVIPGFFAKDTADNLLKRAKLLLEDFSLEGHPMTTFETDPNKAHIGDAYFLESGDKIRYFFETAAFTNGELNRPKELAVNKIGHALHELDDVYRDFTLENDDLITLVKELEFHKDPRVIQSMIICKQKEVGGVVNSHDDSTFLYTNPLSAVGFWFALEDCTPQNGCLSFVLGSHKINKIRKRLERVAGGGTAIKPIEGLEGEEIDWDNGDVEWKVAECKAGDLVLIHGSVIHRSEKNLSQKSRFIYTFHMIEGGAEWPATNWLQPTPGKPFSKILKD